MANETIFRFLSVRPSSIQNGLTHTQRNAPLYKADQTSPFQELLESSLRRGNSIGQIRELTIKFKTTAGYLENPDDLSFPIGKFLDWIQNHLDTPLEAASLADVVGGIYGNSADKLVRAGEFTDSYLKLADTILADTLAKDLNQERNLDAYILRFKLLHLIDLLASADPVLPQETVGSYLNGLTVLIPRSLSPKKEQSPVPPSPPEPTQVPSDASLRNHLSNLQKAHRELSLVATNEEFRWVPKVKINTSSKTLEQKVDALASSLNATALELTARSETKRVTAPPVSDSPATIDKNFSKFILSKKTVDSFSPETKSALSTLRLSTTTLVPTKAIDRIENEIAFTAAQLTSPIAQNEVIAFGGAYLDKRKFYASVADVAHRDRYLLDLINRCQFQAGIGDLLIVRQKLIAYEAAEFAHVENVLAGEVREREHRRLNLREEIITSETEKETEKERDLQSTERNEMQNEAEKTLKQQTQLEAGLQVSGSYGPTVSFAAHLNASFSTTTEETQRKATAYSREVTEKTAEKIRERVRDERRTRTLEEVEEINKHAINNVPATNGHIRGIYRWLNKVYSAQIFNYGQRMMYEFIVPEPAAFFLYAMVDNPPHQTTLIKPEPPKFGSQPLKPNNLTQSNFYDYISAYQVTNAPTPPSQFKVVSFFEKQDGKEANNYGRSSKLTIPDGYEGYAAIVSSYKTFPKDKEKGLKIMVGGQNIDRDDVWGAEYVTFDTWYRNEIAVSVGGFNLTSFVVSVDVFCQLTGEEFAKWQQKVYDAIMQAYTQQKMDYDEKLASADIQKGIQILGNNPLENRRIERDELKKWIIMMLNNSPYLSMSGFLAGYPEPLLDLSRSCKEGAFIRFFENAFEWHNITYIFYPYFWGRKAKWINALHLNDPDPDFAAFLRAGAARVQLPVRPGFEKAIAYFCQFGEIWEGNDVPLRGDNLYVPIVNEITEKLGKIDDGVPYPADAKPWEVIVPTSLVLLQDLDEISGIRDTLTNQTVDLTNND